MRRRILPTLASALLAMTGCSDHYEVIVDLKTDLLPGIEFTRVETAIIGSESKVQLGAEVSDDYVGGFRIAEFANIEPGVHEVRVLLSRSDTRDVAMRTARVTVKANASVTILITRDCASVQCPRPGDDPTLTECVGGACVSPACTSNDPSQCGTAECNSDSDCPRSPIACVEPRCTLGTCLQTPFDPNCGANERCDPVMGCVYDEFMTERDAGPPPPPPMCNAADCQSRGQACCGTQVACTDIHTDPSNCGACGNVCGAGSRCLYDARSNTAGCTNCDAAACGAFGASCCPGINDCTITLADENNCGGCGVRCPAGNFCSYDRAHNQTFCSTCDPDACRAFGTICCPGVAGCVAFLADENNCNGCGIRCAAGQFCSYDRTHDTAFCSPCNPDACAGFGVVCCPGSNGDCTGAAACP